MRQLNKIKPQSYSALFLALIAIYFATSVFIQMLSTGIEMNTTVLLLISEGTILIPGLVWMLIHDAPIGSLGFRKIKPGTFFMTILLAEVLIPIISLVNLVSQLFTTNTMIEASGQLLAENNLVMIIIVGFVGPVCEEVVFRGIIANGLSRHASILGSAIVSGLFFGFMHMNLNQFCYAFVLGLILAIVNYASGSIITSIIIHVVINLQNVLMMMVLNMLYDAMGINMAETAGQVANSDVIYYAIGVYLIMALIFSVVSIPIFGFIARHEGNPKAFSLLRLNPAKREMALNAEAQDGEQNEEISTLKNSRSWWLNPYSVIASVFSIAFIFAGDLILKLFGLG